jgi:subtilase family serine protease
LFLWSRVVSGRRIAPLLLVCALAFVGTGGSASAVRAAAHNRPVCTVRQSTQVARCPALVASDPRSGMPLAYASPPGYDPPDFWSACELPPQTGASWSWNAQTVAIVDAYDDPAVESGLAVYRRQFGLPACTSGNGCLVKVHQNGRSSYPSFDQTWAFEISIDTQMVSALCAGCRILLIETKNNNFLSLFAGVDEAYALGANEISLSWGTPEFTGTGRNGSETSYDPHFQQLNANGQNAAVTAASGDLGQLWYPAASPYVTAVGGTELGHDASTGAWVEQGWYDSGAGCSRYEPQPSWQAAVPELASACPRRAGVDVSFNAVILSIYDSAGFQNQTGWFAATGTSVSTPAIAAVYALAGNAASVTSGSYPYIHRSGFADVTQYPSLSCLSALCSVGPGWDGPTGLGSPRGTSGF